MGRWSPTIDDYGGGIDLSPLGAIGPALADRRKRKQLEGMMRLHREGSRPTLPKPSPTTGQPSDYLSAPHQPNLARTAERNASVISRMAGSTSEADPLGADLPMPLRRGRMGHTLARAGVPLEEARAMSSLGNRAPAAVTAALHALNQRLAKRRGGGMTSGLNAATQLNQAQDLASTYVSAVPTETPSSGSYLSRAGMPGVQGGFSTSAALDPVAARAGAAMQLYGNQVPGARANPFLGPAMQAEARRRQPKPPEDPMAKYFGGAPAIPNPPPALPPRRPQPAPILPDEEEDDEELMQQLFNEWRDERDR